LHFTPGSHFTSLCVSHESIAVSTIATTCAGGHVIDIGAGGLHGGIGSPGFSWSCVHGSGSIAA
jgi:hypothetical protein